jgi:hypothetical protein
MTRNEAVEICRNSNPQASSPPWDFVNTLVALGLLKVDSDPLPALSPGGGNHDAG